MSPAGSHNSRRDSGHARKRRNARRGWHHDGKRRDGRRKADFRKQPPRMRRTISTWCIPHVPMRQQRWPGGLTTPERSSMHSITRPGLVAYWLPRLVRTAGGGNCARGKTNVSLEKMFAIDGADLIAGPAGRLSRREAFGRARAIAFPMIWAALVLYTGSMVQQARRSRRG